MKDQGWDRGKQDCDHAPQTPLTSGWQGYDDDWATTVYSKKTK